MKKIGFIAFLATLTIGSIFAGVFNFGKLHVNFGGIEGSGNSAGETRNVSGFKGIKANGVVHVEVIAQEDFNVAVEADDNLLEHIKTDVRGDTLEIYSEGRISPKSRINVRISMPEINSAEINGVSNAIISNVKTESIDLKANGASKIKIEGEAIELQSKANGASKIDAEGLKVENVNVDANGASKTIVWANNEVEASASGASKIYYTGEPKSVKNHTSGASSVKRK